METVFLPYRASMFDCFESVWQAADADPGCSAYIIPLPYCELNPDGSLGRTHTDIGLYPAHIPVTDPGAYDLEARRPDIIFIHYPYDHMVTNATVHPDYYAKRLRKYCRLLIYIPYFTAPGDTAIPQDHCTLPGVLLADYVIVQSEKTRRAFIGQYAEYDKIHGLTEKFGRPEDKFIALGSPKFDKVITASRDDYALPPEWERLIKKPCGGRKKIILCDTHMFNWLRGGREYFKKINHIFDIFRQRDDVVLWWRPHPNTELNFRIKRPALLETYRALAESYKSEGFGIYDDTPDLHRAIVHSDAYCGDGGSLRALYAAAGKPVLIQNIRITDSRINEEERREYLSSDVISLGNRVLDIEEFERRHPEWHAYWKPLRNPGQTRFILIPDYEYGISVFVNAVYSLDEENAKAVFMTGFPGETQPGLYHPPIRIGQKLLFIPNTARQWAFYDLCAKEWSYEPIPEELYPSGQRYGMFGWFFVFGGSIIILPGESGAAAKYDIENGAVTYGAQRFSEIKNSVINADWGIVTGLALYKASVFLVTPQTNKVIEADPEALSVIKTHTIGTDSAGFRATCQIPNTDTVYLLKFRAPEEKPWTETIIKWSIETGEAKELTDLPVNFGRADTLNALSHFLFWNGAVYALPLQGDTVLRIDIHTDAVTRFALTPAFDFFKRKSDFYEGWAKGYAMPYVIFNGKRMKFTAQLPYDYSLADIDFDTGEVTDRRKWHVTGIEDRHTARYKGTETDICESKLYTLEHYINDIAGGGLPGSRMDAGYAYADGSSGKAIYSFVKSALDDPTAASV